MVSSYLKLNFNSDKKPVWGYFVTYAILYSGTVFLPIKRELYYLIYALLFITVIVKKKLYVGDRFKSVFILIFGIILIQTFKFYSFSLDSVIGTFLLLTTSYFVFILVKDKLIDYFIDIVVLISLVSFVFYFGSYLSRSFYTIIASIPVIFGTDVMLRDQNFLVYTVEPFLDGVLRNAGNFTEPGAFAAVLNMVLAFNLIKNPKIFNLYNFIFMVAIITTLSTAGYVAMFIILLVRLIIARNVYVLLLVPIILFFGIYFFNKLEFLSNKIDSQYSHEVKGSGDRGRFASAKMDLLDLEEHPFFGRGMTKNTRFEGVSSWVGDEAPRDLTNGLTNNLVKYGIIGSIIYFLLLSTSFKKYSTYQKGFKYTYVIPFFALLVVSFGQDSLFTPFFLSFLFIPDFYK